MFRVLACSVLGLSLLHAAEDNTPADAPAQAAGSKPVRGQPAPVPLNAQGTVLLDRAEHRLLLKAKVVLREGILEMFLCKAQTKEHESILAIDSEAFVIHAGLQVLGAEPGTPVRYENETFHPPTGAKLDIFVAWREENGTEHRVKAQSWVRSVTRRYYEQPLEKLPAGVILDPDGELRYDAKNKVLIWFGPMSAEQRDKLQGMSADQDYRQAIRAFFADSQSRPLETEWVFAGSGFFTQKDGTQWYQAEAGNLICVSNFSDAMIDVSIESSASNDARLFEPYTERIPPLGTPVTIELIPRKPKAEPNPDAPKTGNDPE